MANQLNALTNRITRAAELVSFLALKLAAQGEGLRRAPTGRELSPLRGLARLALEVDDLRALARTSS